MVSYHLYNYLKDLKGIYECIPLVPQNLDAYPSFCLSHFGGRMWRTNQSLSCTAEEWLLWWLCPAHTLHTRVLTWFNVNKRKHRFSQRFSELRRFTSEHSCFFIKPSELLTSRRITWSWKIQESTKVHFQSTKVHSRSTKVYFQNLGNGISGTRNLVNTSGSRNPVRSKPRDPNQTPRNPSNTKTFQTWGSQPSEPGLGSEPGFPEPVPGTRFLPGTTPACPEHTEIYIVQRPHSILLLGKNVNKWWRKTCRSMAWCFANVLMSPQNAPKLIMSNHQTSSNLPRNSSKNTPANSTHTWRSKKCKSLLKYLPQRSRGVPQCVPLSRGPLTLRPRRPLPPPKTYIPSAMSHHTDVWPLRGMGAVPVGDSRLAWRKPPRCFDACPKSDHDSCSFQLPPLPFVVEMGWNAFSHETSPNPMANTKNAPYACITSVSCPHISQAVFKISMVSWMLGPILQILAGGHAMSNLHVDLHFNKNILLSNMHLNLMLSNNPHLTGGEHLVV